MAERYAAKRTTDHEEIRHWVEERDGRPAVVRRTHDKEGSGLLRIDFGKPEESLEGISWDEFFKIFEENNLAFLYQEETGTHEPSFFFKIIRRQDGNDDTSTTEIEEEE